MKNPYIPQPGSLPARVCAFFAEQPDEELEGLDIITKFDALQVGMHTQLKLAVENGLLAIRKTKQPNGRVANLYCAGPKLQQGRPVAAPAAAAPAAPAVPAPVAAPVVYRSIDDATPAEWDAASKRVRERMQAPPPKAAAAVPDITYEPLVGPITGAAGGKWARHLIDIAAAPITEQGYPTRRWPRVNGNAMRKAICSWNKHHHDVKLHARIRGEHVIVQRIV